MILINSVDYNSIVRSLSSITLLSNKNILEKDENGKKNNVLILYNNIDNSCIYDNFQFSNEDIEYILATKEAANRPLTNRKNLIACKELGEALNLKYIKDIFLSY